MKKIIINASVICMIGFGSVTGYAQQQQQQQQESYPHRYIGLGIRVAGIQVSDLTSRPYPANRLVLDLDPHKYFRIECQLGIFNKTSEAAVSQGNSGTAKFELQDKSTFLGFGLMGMYPKDKGKFVAGLRYSINKYSSDDIYYNPDPSVAKNTGKMTMLSGMIGGEYFLARFFSIGAEFSVSSLKDVYDPASLTTSGSTTDKTLLTEGNLIFRFYPF